MGKTNLLSMERIPYNFIAIEGNIGAGKTTLAKRMADEFNAKLILERFEDNSFLPKFYENPTQYAFPLEMSFLAGRYQQLKEQLPSQDLFKEFTISDYFIDKSLIFSRNNLASDELALYKRLFDIISSFLPRPELIVYLYHDTSRLLRNIESRGRSYEANIKAEYLENIQRNYFNHFKSLKETRILVIDLESTDFVSDNKEYKALVDMIFRDYPIGIHTLFLKEQL
jgi:deoxyadenosine/deoxycytidine kinase